MAARELVRPLPLILIVLFTAVAVTDFVHTVREEEPPPPDLLNGEVVQFAMHDPVFDLRAGAASSGVAVSPVPALVGPWSAPGSAGTWVLGDGASLEFSLEDGGHRVLLLHCRSAKQRRPHRFFEVSVNGRQSGEVDLDSGPGPYRLVLSDGLVRPGTNSVAFHFPGSADGSGTGLFLLVRQVGLVFDQNSLQQSASAGAPIGVDSDRDAVIISTSGRLWVPFVLDDRTDALHLRYKFSGETGRAEVQVARPEGGGEGKDAAFTQTISAEQRGSGRIRVPLHGRRGDFVFQVNVELGSMSERLRLTSVRLVEEGDPTGRRKGGRRRH